MHLQDSYYAEMTAVGTGTQIGYNAPASNTFEYTATEAGVWKAKSKGALNDCPKDAEWTVTSTAPSTGLQHVAATPTGDKSAECAALTPSFTSIGAATH